MEVVKIDREGIINQLVARGYVKKLITYEDLQQLHKDFGYNMSEKYFAYSILAISSSAYGRCKNQGRKVVILRSKERDLSQEEIQAIIQTLKEQGYTNKTITYKELQQLHVKHGEGMSESDFAQKILGISYSNFGSCKNEGSKTIALKSKERELSLEEIQTIIQTLKEKGYIDKRISYEELQQLYVKHGEGMSESDFAEKILGLLPKSYLNCKKIKGRKVRILKTKGIELPSEKIQTIIQTLTEQGYTGKKITYEELQQLHVKNGEGMSESDFAQKILGISSSTYDRCKTEGKNVVILKSKKRKLSQKEIQTIIQTLKEKGYIDKRISYEELQQLHEEHGEGMSESDFAQKILGISYNSYCNCKNRRNKVTVLNKQKAELAPEKIEIIIQKLKEERYIGKKITYEQLQQLHKEHGEGISESDFAQKILGLSSRAYDICKSKGKNVVILKAEERELSQQEIQAIIQILKDKGYTDKRITYKELQQLHVKYGEGMSESNFAQKILGISDQSYLNCRKIQGRKVTILKTKVIERELSLKEIQAIIQTLKEKGYAGKKITYEELQQLHKEHGEGMSESNFAQKILELSYNNYCNCRSRRNKVTVLNKQKTELTPEKIEIIIQTLKDQGYTNKTITYEELQQLHKKYGEGISESDFAQKILGLLYSSYLNCKNYGWKAKILKTKDRELPLKEIQAIIQILTEQGYIGKKITYEELQQLHKKYGEGMSERNFAQKVLGIQFGSYYHMKHLKNNGFIKDVIAYDKAKEILELHITEARFYSKDYISKICVSYSISIEDFITYVFLKCFIYDISHILDAFERNSGLWIGKIRLSEEFAKQNVKLIERVASKIIRSLCCRYHIKREKQNDYIQDAILYIIENMGDVERNYEHDLNTFESVIRAKIKKHCQSMIVDDLIATSRVSSFTRISRHHKASSKEFEIQIPDPTIDVERDVIQSQSSSDLDNESDICIKLLSKYIEAGCDRKTALSMVAEDMNIEPDTMLEYMQHYLITNGKVKIKPNGTVEWGDPR